MNTLPDRASRPHETDDVEDRMGSIEPLDFSGSKDERRGRIGDARSESWERPSVAEDVTHDTERALADGHEEGVSLDDLSPETLIDESGTRSPGERGEAGPLDQDLSIVDGEEIGAGYGLDEAELAKVSPLDGKAWEDGEEEGRR